MKFAVLLLVALTCFAQEPKKVECSASQPDERPGVWDVHVVTTRQDGKRVNRFVSEHQSRKSALKACDQILSTQEKRWKAEQKKSK